MEAKIKLLQVGTTEDGTILLRSQLSLMKNVNSHTLKNGKLSIWDGDNFVETNHPYQIVKSFEEMKTQQL